MPPKANLESMPNLETLDHPFAINPSPRYFYLAPQYTRTLQDAIRTVVRREGLCIIEGPIGCGKSTMFRFLLDWLGENVGKEANIVYLSNPNYSSAMQLLKAICEALGIPRKTNKLDQITVFKQYLLEQDAQNRVTLLLVDEAHRLNGEQFELIRELFNFSHNDRFLIQVVIAGEEKPLHHKLKHKQAIVSRAQYYISLAPLDEDETAELIKFRLRVAGLREDLFTHQAVTRVHKISGGIPRSIVKLAGHAFLKGGGGAERVTAEMVDAALADYPRFADA